MIDSRTGAENIKDEPGTSCVPESTMVFMKEWVHVERSQSGSVPKGQSWDNMNNEINAGIIEIQPIE